MLAKIQKKLSKTNLKEITETAAENKGDITIAKADTSMSEIDEIAERPDENTYSISDRDRPENYKNDAYWSLPENVRKAIDFAKTKQQHSEFSSRLTNLNDKLEVYT